MDNSIILKSMDELEKFLDINQSKHEKDLKVFLYKHIQSKEGLLTRRTHARRKGNNLEQWE